MYVLKNDKIILKGDRNWTDGLWDIVIKNKKVSNQNPQRKQLPNVLNVIIQKDTTAAELIAYFQGCCFSP